MQQFTVPQFIDVEDKIIGPVTTRQFVIMLSGFLLIGISYKLFDFSLFVVVGIIILLIFGVFAFGKINGRPFHYFVLNFIQTIKKPKLKVWSHNLVAGKDGFSSDPFENLVKSITTPSKTQPTLSRLTELALIVDTQGAYGGEEEGGIEIKPFDEDL